MAVTSRLDQMLFWYGCNMARHGEIIRLVTQILQAVGVDAAPAGGPAHCCGSPQEASARIAGGMASRTVEKFNATGREQVVTWCPSCHMNMDDFMAPVTPPAFETRHITELLHARRERLRELMVHPVVARAVLHSHAGFNGRVPVNDLVPDLLRLVAGVEVIDLGLRVPGHMCSAISAVPGALAASQHETLDVMAAARADTLVTVFHSCHREIVALERGRDFRVVNWIHLLAEGMGLEYQDEYKIWRNAVDLRGAVGPERVAAAGEVAFERLVEPELRRPPTV